MIIDLTATMKDNMFVYPGNPKVSIQYVDLMKEYGFHVTNIQMCVHSGTHIDTFLHCIPDARNTETIDLEHYVGKARCISIPTDKGQAIKFPQSFDFNLLKNVKILLVSTGWEDKNGTSDFYDGFPNLDETFIEKLIEYKIHTIGLDSPSVDSLETSNKKHIKLFENKIAVIEALINLKNIAGKDVFFSAAPLKIENCDGSPVRAYAIID